MNILSRAAGLLSLRFSFAREIAAPPKDKNNELSPVEWTSDSVLRKLAEDYREGKTKWVLASDMNEFFIRLDAFNETRDYKSKIYVCISRKAEDFLACAIKVGTHLAPPDTAEGKALPFDLMRDLGPQGIGIDNLRMQQGNKCARAYYHADPMNTNINIETPNGWVKFEFGMEGSGFDTGGADLDRKLTLG